MIALLFIQYMLRDELKKLLDQALNKKAKDGWPAVEAVLEHPVEKRFGDFSTNIGMRLAKQLKKAPIEIARDFKTAIESIAASKKFLEKIEVVAPGFINFFVAKERFYKELKDITENKEKYGALKLGKGEKLIVEHTSVNPNKAMHVGHLRNMAIGDSLAALMKNAGYKVEVENYIDDTGVQVADVVLAINHFKEKPKTGQKFDHFCWDIYSRIQKEYEKNPKLVEERTKIQHALEKGDNPIAHMAQEIVNRILNDQLQTTGQMGVFYNVFIFESSILKSGLWQKTFESLKKTGRVAYETEGPNKGCWVFKNLALSSEEKMKNPDKILVTSKGAAVYTAKDIAYHLWKFGQAKGDFKYQKIAKQQNEEDLWGSSQKGVTKKFGQAKRVINVVDVRQTYPQMVVRAALKELGHEKESENLKHISYEVVSLSASTAKELGVEVEEGKESYAMSGRKGIGVKADDLFNALVKKIKEKQAKDGVEAGAIEASKIASAAIKAYMLKQSLNQEVAFDVDQALSLTGDSGPYLQYTHARIKGILKKANSKGRKAAKLNLLKEDEEAALLREIYLFPEIVEQATTQYSPHFIYHYLLGLAQSFNTFYNKWPVLKAPSPELASARISLVAATGQVIKNGLKLLGIDAPDRM